MNSFILSEKEIPNLRLFHNAIKAQISEFNGFVVDDEIVTVLLNVEVTSQLISAIEAIEPPPIPPIENNLIVDGDTQIIVPSELPSSPNNGWFGIDSSDNKFKIFNAVKNRWVVLGDAEDVYFDNSDLNLSDAIDNVQEAIENLKGFRIQSAQFQFIGQMNSDQYLYSNSDSVSGLLTSARRSGNESNGYRYSNSAPLTALYSGRVVSAAASITGLAVSTGSPSQDVELKFELWKVGFNNQGIKLGDITFNINSNIYNIGNYWNSSVLSSFAENQQQDVEVVAGDLLALKFIRQTGSGFIVAVTNTTIVLEIEGSAQ